MVPVDVHCFYLVISVSIQLHVGGLYVQFILSCSDMHVFVLLVSVDSHCVKFGCVFAFDL